MKNSILHSTASWPAPTLTRCLLLEEEAKTVIGNLSRNN